MRYFGPEKRRYKRLAVSLPIKYKLGSGGSSHNVHTIDISGGGVCIGPIPLSNEWMLGNCEVELEIMLPHFRRHLKATAEVVRVEASKRPHHIHHRRRHKVRLRFCEISEEDRKTIEKFVNTPRL
ncbi:MAG: PilZ domain-containing protein [Candidatus Omnitrophica bacterium]|nr:PilZ domain-containing protein [Candidatus Omnitrophota bacterium]